MQLASLPKSFREEESPVISIDSPFPPLKTDLRYRGVYERAGFDVNLGQRSASDDRSFYLRKSPGSPAIPGMEGFSPVSSGHRDISPTSNTSSTRSSKNSREKQSPVEKQPVYTSHFRPFERSTQSLNTTASPSSQRAFSSSQTSVTSAPQSVARPYIKQFQPEKKNPRLVYGNGTGEKKTELNDRNKKQLKLFIPNSESSFHTAKETPTETPTEVAAEASAEALVQNSPFERTHPRRSSTPSTSASSSENFTTKTDASSPISVKTSELLQRTPYPGFNMTGNTSKDIEHSLAGLRTDVKEHKAFDPRGMGSHTAAPKPTVPKTSTFVPAKGDLAESFHKEDLEASVDTLQDSNSFRFNNSRFSAETADTSRSDYDQFLQTSTNDKKPSRNSQFSTISSIISKQRKSSIQFNDTGDNQPSEEDEDDEVALELQRQLEEIKTGSQLSLVSNNALPSEDSFVTASNSFASKSSTLPVFKISNDTEERIEENQEGEVSDCETEINDINDTISPVHIDNAVPLVAEKKEQGKTKEPFTPHTKQAHFETDSIFETPDTIKPLSPKNHLVEQELESINFKYQQHDLADVSMEAPVTSDQSDIDILGKNPTPAEFEAFPKSVFEPQFPSFRNSEVSRKAPPGTGPCRACGLNINPEAKGAQKAIYSKLGDLSGQWHRGCFKCSYAGCSTRFNKDVTPYVLLDNAFCNHHYHTLNNTLCETCHVGIEGECIENELKQKWHLSCLKCTKCEDVINNDYFLINHQIVCEADAGDMIKDLKNSGLTTLDKVEKRRTRMLFLE